ncbi:putative flavin-containing amine oxidoreductase family protein [Desulfamplus magnetovallimortis]|uniref:Putative flavin-containing amine oxidoreductase family protein n=1 Tax=Desulfamplus magnetovallimortis TaxID=1246637 RepID=A0A1W1HBW0_9BACT|nr:FAD-dependent oxidoreductase [Desulfamplus magnetovallimortis]SLM29977.1 putative flavin-containing amine oxidoreductase family protein [Desulfamplus magnetovallimortis]
MKILIIGGGPCGLGAAWRLNELGHEKWELYEQNSHPGGLSASFKDSENFWWDIGGHVLFSHYRYFDTVMDTVMDKENDWLYHDRSAWVWMENRFVPYPIQNNIHRLSKETFRSCIHGLLDLHAGSNKQNCTSHTNGLKHFGDWINAGFGEGLAQHFLRPYNYKVWAWPVEELSHDWVGERVATVDLKRILDNHLNDKDDIGWGPNSRFRFPKYRGTGAVWENIAAHLPQEKMHFNAELKSINIKNKTITFKDGTKKEYDLLISSIPITALSQMTTDLSLATWTAQKTENALTQQNLKHSSTHVAGIALKGETPEHLRDKCWIYFPENDNPFYRVTVFSNYSPYNVPDIKTSWSLMCEVSESPAKKVRSNPEKVMDEIIQGALNTKLINSRDEIDHTWYLRMEHGYPTPSIERNKLLFPMLKEFEKKGVYSRGRFGAWRYEVGNMDHSFMQGVECAGKILYQGEELTLWYPGVVNSPHPSTFYN